jgi:UDP-N-acetylmuramate: L-alanyl-gamma-D-glutamyl-meso-diaminopimelate ligase
MTIGSHERLLEIPANERFDGEEVASELRRRGLAAEHVPEVDEIVELVVQEAKEGDVLMIFSNGAFGGLHAKLLARLAAREGR